MMSQERVEYKCSFVFTKSQYDAAEYNLVKYVLVKWIENEANLLRQLTYP